MKRAKLKNRIFLPLLILKDIREKFFLFICFFWQKSTRKFWTSISQKRQIVSCVRQCLTRGSRFLFQRTVSTARACSTASEELFTNHAGLAKTFGVKPQPTCDFLFTRKNVSEHLYSVRFSLLPPFPWGEGGKGGEGLKTVQNNERIYQSEKARRALCCVNIKELTKAFRPSR